MYLLSDPEIQTSNEYWSLNICDDFVLNFSKEKNYVSRSEQNANTNFSRYLNNQNIFEIHFKMVAKKKIESSK